MSEPKPTLDYRNPVHAGEARRRRRIGPSIAWTVGGLVALLALSAFLLPSEGRSRESSTRVVCARNLRMIGTAVALYSIEYGGQLPPDWPTLLATEDVVPDMFVCPSTNHIEAAGPTSQAVVASMLAGDHLDYVWAGAGLRERDLTPAVVLAFDVEDHRSLDGRLPTYASVLLGDGSVTFVDVPTAKAIRAQHIAGVRPIRLPPPATAGPTSTSAP